MAAPGTPQAGAPQEQGASFTPSQKHPQERPGIPNCSCCPHSSAHFGLQGVNFCLNIVICNFACLTTSCPGAVGLTGFLQRLQPFLPCMFVLVTKQTCAGALHCFYSQDTFPQRSALMNCAEPETPLPHLLQVCKSLHLCFTHMRPVVSGSVFLVGHRAPRPPRELFRGPAGLILQLYLQKDLAWAETRAPQSHEDR